MKINTVENVKEVRLMKQLTHFSMNNVTSKEEAEFMILGAYINLNLSDSMAIIVKAASFLKETLTESEFKQLANAYKEVSRERGTLWMSSSRTREVKLSYIKRAVVVFNEIMDSIVAGKF